ncbi:MAG: SGNH/GDSL hydrolase family protein [Clostridia bacterium]|nr:SGNH/GDSL hydrolase family protein [Clostridia bacterium]
MKIVFYGDSITDMGRNRDDADGSVYSYGVGYTNFVVGELTCVNPKKYECVNRGISGNRVVDLYARIKSAVWNQKPDVLSILIGVNDVWHEISREDGVDIVRWERVYRTMIEETKERLPDIKIMILEPFILEGSATDGEERWQRFQAVKEYAKVARKIAEDYNLIFVPLQEKFDEAKAKFGADYYTFDGVHPLAAGARMVANEWLKGFAKIDK